MEISCKEVIRELSEYIDQDVPPALSQEITDHLADCQHCTAVYDGTRNVVRIIGDDRSFDLPAGFSQRLRDRLAKEEPGE